MSKIKVAFCIPYMMTVGGVETVFINTLNELLKNPELDIKIITHAKTHIRFQNLPIYVCYPLQNWFERMGAHRICKVFPLNILRRVIFSLYKKYRRLIIRHKFTDIDVFVDYKNGEFYKELKYFAKPKIAWMHGALAYYEKNGTISRLGQYSRIVGITKEFITDFAVKYPNFADRVVHIYNPVDVNAIRVLALNTNIPSGLYFSHVSRLVAGKDIKTVLDAFDLFAARADNVKLYIVGDGDRAQEFMNYAKKLKSYSRIVFTGAIANPYGIMKGSIANILSSQSEGFGMTLVESMALSVPIISSDYKYGAREILMNGKCGMLFDIGNAAQLADCMWCIFSDGVSAKKRADAAFSSLTRFNVTNIADQISSLLLNFTNGGKL